MSLRRKVLTTFSVALIGSNVLSFVATDAMIGFYNRNSTASRCKKVQGIRYFQGNVETYYRHLSPITKPFLLGAYAASKIEYYPEEECNSEYRMASILPLKN